MNVGPAKSDDCNNLVSHEIRESRAHQDKYFGRRMETGVGAKIVSKLSGPPSVTYLDTIDAGRSSKRSLNGTEIRKAKPGS